MLHLSMQSEVLVRTVEILPCLSFLSRSSCTVKKNSSSLMGTFQTFTKWTFLTSGLVYQVLYTLYVLMLNVEQ